MALFLSIFFVVQAFSSIFAADYLINGMKNSLLYTLLMTLLACVATTSQAEDLATYYAKANNKKAAALKTAMYGIIHSHTNIGYDGLLEAYHESDVRADGYLRDWYSNATEYVIGGPKENHSYKKEGDGYNREHLVPQSWFGSGEMKSDLVQVVPTDGFVNNRRSNHPLGETNGDQYQSQNGYCKLGACTTKGYSGTVFEPNDEVKGDIARIYFYVLACYENLHPNWNGGTASNVFDGKAYPGLKTWALQMFLRWAKQDPVDDVERARNEVVYKWQKNRNPFVDYPSLCEYVWGDSIDYAFDVTLPHGQSTEEIPDIPDDPDDPDDPDTPDDPVDPDDPDTPDNPDAQSGTIVLSDYTWTSTTHPTYGNGFTTTVNGLTLSYYKAGSATNPVNVSQYEHLRFYDKSVFLIEGAEVSKVVFHAAIGSATGCSIEIGSTSYSFRSGEFTWTGSMHPFLCTASKQSRISSIDVTVVPPTPDGITAISSDASFRLVFDSGGRCVGPTVPLRRGVYVVREGEKTSKIIVK